MKDDEDEEAGYVSATTIAIGIMNVLTEHGIDAVNTRQTNAIIKAANVVVDELNKPHRPALPNSGITEWLNCDETGQASLYMASRLMAGTTEIGIARYAHPLDPSDFGRCVKMLDAVPGVRPSLQNMASCSAHWKELVENWAELETLYREEYPTGEAPKLYARMQELYRQAGLAQ